MEIFATVHGYVVVVSAINQTLYFDSEYLPNFLLVRSNGVSCLSKMPQRIRYTESVFQVLGHNTKNPHIFEITGLSKV